MKEIKKILIAKAYEIGFDLIGFAKAEPLREDFKNYIQWLELGFNAQMGYMERNLDKRKDVSFIIDNAKTVIVTATNYNTPFYHNELENHSDGKISRYAWGEDYHNVILPKLESLALDITRIEPEAKSKCYVDTGPILEKVWAVKAGLGWQGKNSLILTKKYGSYIFLGIIITTIGIEADKVMPDHCGSCKACIENCPTNAIVQPKVVDSNKCISYWTIETNGEIEFPENVARNLNNWVFGCDICQEVCPWNRKQVFTNELEYYPRLNQIVLESKIISRMNHDDFNLRFKNSPIKRAKLKGIIKNMSYLKKNPRLKKTEF